MSVRYALSVIPDPRFTARAYRARQLICGQYACWAAEMHPVHLPLLEYLDCPDNRIDAVVAAMTAAAQDFIRDHYTRAPLPPWAVAADQDSVYLDFTDARSYRQPLLWPVNRLRQSLRERLERIDGLPPLPSVDPENPPLRIGLLEYAALPESVFAAAAAFAQEVVRDLLLPRYVSHWQLQLLRFESSAAGDDWNSGAWAADLRFQWLNAIALS